MSEPRRIVGYVIAALWFLGIAWIGIAVGLRAGVGIIADQGVPAQFVGDPTAAQAAIMQMNGYIKLSTAVGAVSVVLAGVGQYVLMYRT